MQGKGHCLFFVGPQIRPLFRAMEAFIYSFMVASPLFDSRDQQRQIIQPRQSQLGFAADMFGYYFAGHVPHVNQLGFVNLVLGQIHRLFAVALQVEIGQIRFLAAVAFPGVFPGDMRWMLSEKDLKMPRISWGIASRTAGSSD